MLLLAAFMLGCSAAASSAATAATPADCDDAQGLHYCPSLQRCLWGNETLVSEPVCPPEASCSAKGHIRCAEPAGRACRPASACTSVRLWLRSQGSWGPSSEVMDIVAGSKSFSVVYPEADIRTLPVTSVHGTDVRYFGTDVGSQQERVKFMSVLRNEWLKTSPRRIDITVALRRVEGATPTSPSTPSRAVGPTPRTEWVLESLDVLTELSCLGDPHGLLEAHDFSTWCSTYTASPAGCDTRVPIRGSPVIRDICPNHCGGCPAVLQAEEQDDVCSPEPGPMMEIPTRNCVWDLSKVRGCLSDSPGFSKTWCYRTRFCKTTAALLEHRCREMSPQSHAVRCRSSTAEPTAGNRTDNAAKPTPEEAWRCDPTPGSDLWLPLQQDRLNRTAWCADIHTGAPLSGTSVTSQSAAALTCSGEAAAPKDGVRPLCPEGADLSQFSNGFRGPTCREYTEAARPEMRVYRILLGPTLLVTLQQQTDVAPARVALLTLEGGEAEVEAVTPLDQGTPATWGAAAFAALRGDAGGGSTPATTTTPTAFAAAIRTPVPHAYQGAVQMWELHRELYVPPPVTPPPYVVTAPPAPGFRPGSGSTRQGGGDTPTAPCGPAPAATRQGGGGTPTSASVSASAPTLPRSAVPKPGSREFINFAMPQMVFFSESLLGVALEGRAVSAFSGVGGGISGSAEFHSVQVPRVFDMGPRYRDWTYLVADFGSWVGNVKFSKRGEESSDGLQYQTSIYLHELDQVNLGTEFPRGLAALSWGIYPPGPPGGGCPLPDERVWDPLGSGLPPSGTCSPKGDNGSEICRVGDLRRRHGGLPTLGKPGRLSSTALPVAGWASIEGQVLVIGTSLPICAEIAVSRGFFYEKTEVTANFSGGPQGETSISGVISISQFDPGSDALVRVNLGLGDGGAGGVHRNLSFHISKRSVAELGGGGTCSGYRPERDLYDPFGEVAGGGRSVSPAECLQFHPMYPNFETGCPLGDLTPRLRGLRDGIPAHGVVVHPFLDVAHTVPALRPAEGVLHGFTPQAGLAVVILSDGVPVACAPLEVSGLDTPTPASEGQSRGSGSPSTKSWFRTEAAVLLFLSVGGTLLLGVTCYAVTVWGCRRESDGASEPQKEAACDDSISSHAGACDISSLSEDSSSQD